MTSVSSQQALASTQATVTQTTSSSTPVVGSSCNTLITTQAFSLSTGAVGAFPYQNIIISPETTVTATLVSTTSTAGNPVVSLSGQTNGVIWVEVGNVSPTGAVSGTMTIATLIYS